ncbi:LytR family transcriptional regulator OS=Streptomyces alboniger OX=132473 GN=CP975_17000 PE=4 SV=1 [Streptomyces alboniger]
MSMLTPPGMGGEYRVTGDKYPRMRRTGGHRRIVLAVVASAAALALISWGTLQLIHVFSGGTKASAASGAADCDREADRAARAKKAKPLPKPGQIKVNVLNATPRGGLAKKTAEELKKRGFLIGEVGNATKAYDKKVKGAGILLGAPTATDTALAVLGTQLVGAERRTDARKGAEVDLIIGTKFTDLAGKKDADKALAKLTKPEPTSEPTSGPSRKNC